MITYEHSKANQYKHACIHRGSVLSRVAPVHPFYHVLGHRPVLRAPSDNAQCIIHHFKAKHASAQQVCFDASSTTVCYFLRDLWPKYQADIPLQSSTATLRELLIQLHNGGNVFATRPAAHSDTDRTATSQNQCELHDYSESVYELLCIIQCTMLPLFEAEKNHCEDSPKVP